MRRALATLACGGVLAAVVLASADAPKDQYDVFDSQNATIHDQYTRLEWERFPEQMPDGGGKGGEETQAVMRQRCMFLGADWRLPTVKELLTIVDEDPHRLYDDGGIAYRWIDRYAFPTAAPAPYWSSSRVTGPAGKAWAVDFSSGLPTIESPTAALHGRCVRTF